MQVPRRRAPARPSVEGPKCGVAARPEDAKAVEAAAPSEAVPAPSVAAHDAHGTEVCGAAEYQFEPSEKDTDQLMRKIVGPGEEIDGSRTET